MTTLNEFNVVCDIPFSPAQCRRVADAAPAARFEFRSPRSRDDHTRPKERRDFTGADVLVSHWPPEDWSLARELRWMQTDSAGVDYLERDELWSRGVPLTNAAGAYATQIGQYVVGNILGHAERHSGRQAAQARRLWPTQERVREQMIGDALRGQLAVIVGYGGIGREVARLVNAFGMRVVAIKANPASRIDSSFHLPGTGDPEGQIPTAIFGIEQLEEVASEANFLIIAIPLTSRTRHLIDASVLGVLSATAWIVNVARGAVIDEDALITALREERLGGAILDVFEHEPLPPSSALWGLPNVVITPHCGGGGPQSRELFSHLLAENLGRFARGTELLNVVDPNLRY